jgi:pyrophosphatase PpaX
MDNFNLEKYKGIIFDLDGVIFDIVGAVKQSVEDGVDKYKLRDKLKITLDEAFSEVAHLIEDLQNYPIPKIILNAYDLLQIKLLEGTRLIKKLRILIYVYNQFNKYKEEAGIYEGIEDIIKNLHNLNKKLAILTNNKNTHAEDVLKRFNLDQYFDLIIGFNEVEEVKPSPEGILKILESWKMKPSEAIFIGDMVTDIQAGKAANVKMVCVASGLAPKDTLLEYEPDKLVENTFELKELFKL